MCNSSLSEGRLRLCPTLARRPHKTDYHVVCCRVRSSDLSFLFFIRQMSSELPWDVEFESTYMPTTPRSESVAPHPIVNPLTHVCWPAYRIGNQILDELNLAETECLENRIIWTGTQRQLSKVEEEDMMVCWQSVTPMVKVRDLGVFIDRELTMEAHVSNTVRGCRYQLRRVARSLTLDSQRALATAFVASRIVCNSVLYGVAKGEVQRLQMVLNAAARLVVGTGKFSQVTPILRDVLHCSLYSIESATKSPYWLGTVFTA